MLGSVLPEKTSDFTHRDPAAIAILIEVTALAWTMLVGRTHGIEVLRDRKIFVSRRAGGIHGIGHFKASSIFRHSYGEGFRGDLCSSHSEARDPAEARVFIGLEWRS
jgi:hypothetical protein